nr:hypothetical protein [Tanacetum cinerariifolium]
VVTGTTVIIITVIDQTGKAVVTTTAATTTTLETTTGVSVMDVTRETGVSSPTDLSILVSSSPGVPLRANPTRSALRVDVDTPESVVELLDCKKNTTASTSGQADKKPGASGRVFAITEDHATKTSVTGTTVIIMTVMDQTGEAMVTNTAAATTTTTLTTTIDTHESVVELLVPASSVVKLAICKRIARRTSLRVHLVRLIRIQ